MRTLESARIGLVVVRVGNPKERVFTRGRPEAGYVPDPLAGRTLAALAAAGAERADSAVEAARAARDILGSGPTAKSGRGVQLTALGPFLALLALVPLALLLRAPAFRRLAAAE
jgi:hypothetical protein